ncbi:4Fe-4S dicluster domain-containing protein [Chloroflexota bacterium]
MLKRLFSDPTELMNIDEGILKGLVISPPRRVDNPTYEIVEPAERYDSRDHVWARMAMPVGSPAYEDYYSRHPEKKAVDDDLRDRGKRSGGKLLDSNRVNEEISISGFYGAIAASRPKLVDAHIRIPLQPKGMCKVETAEVDPATMSRKIKAFGLQLGAGKVGITELNQKWVYTHDLMPSYGQPIDCNYKYVICMAVPQDPFLMASHNSLGEEWEVGWKYAYASFISVVMANTIRHLGWPARPAPTFSTHYIVCPVYIDAGIGEDGRCGQVVTKEFGNNFRPGDVLTDLPLVPDKPVDFGLQDFCEKCKICADMCPAGAIPKGGKEIVRGVRKWYVDAEKCIRYMYTIGRTCGICQCVCPWNHSNNWFHNSVRETASRLGSARKSIISADKLFYKHKPGPDPKWMTEPVQLRH